jgi:hypothetical protein
MTVARLDELFINRAELPVIEPRQDIVIHKSKATAVVWDTGIESGYIIRTGKSVGTQFIPIFRILVSMYCDKRFYRRKNTYLCCVPISFRSFR